MGHSEQSASGVKNLICSRERLAITTAMLKNKKIQWFVLLTFSFLLFLGGAVAHAATDLPFQEQKPNIVIPVPTLKPFTNIIKPTEGPDKEYFFVPYLAEYLAAIYSYLTGIAGIFAIAMIMYGGIKWIFSAGDSGKISKAKETITHAVIGLVLVLGSYLLLFALNPDLVTFKALKIKSVPQILFDDNQGDTTSDLTSDVVANAQKLGINCPQSGGSTEIQKIVTSMQGKVAYRFGGKGGPPPYKEIKYTDFNNNCPPGNICLDCSGFIGLVYKCAGLPTPGSGTDGIFKSAETINIAKSDFSQSSVNNTPLKPGDLIGWKTGDQGKKSGHVVMYIGNGQVVESFGGGTAGRQPGANPRISSLSRLKYPWTYIRRAP